MPARRSRPRAPTFPTPPAAAQPPHSSVLPAGTPAAARCARLLGEYCGQHALRDVRPLLVAASTERGGALEPLDTSWTLAQSRCQNIVQPPHTRRGPAFFGADFSRTCVRFPGQVYRSRYCTPATWNLYLAQLKTNTALGGYSLVALLYQPWPESCGRAQRNCLHVLLPLRTRCVAHHFFLSPVCRRRDDRASGPVAEG